MDKWVKSLLAPGKVDRETGVEVGGPQQLEERIASEPDLPAPEGLREALDQLVELKIPATRAAVLRAYCHYFPEVAVEVLARQLRQVTHEGILETIGALLSTYASALRKQPCGELVDLATSKDTKPAPRMALLAGAAALAPERDEPRRLVKAAAAGTLGAVGPGGAEQWRWLERALGVLESSDARDLVDRAARDDSGEQWVRQRAAERLAATTAG